MSYSCRLHLSLNLIILPHLQGRVPDCSSFHGLFSCTSQCIHVCCKKKKREVTFTDVFDCVLALSERSASVAKNHNEERSHLAVVACGPRLEETLTMLKSAVLFSKKHLHFYIFAEDELHDSFRKAVSVRQHVVIC